MRFTLLAVAAGLAIGLLAGGRFHHLARRSLRAEVLLVAGLALQLVAGRMDGAGAGTLLLVSFGLLLAFALANLATVGMWLVGAGIALNLVVMGLNGGMPVRASALERAGVAEPGRAGEVQLSGRHHLERSSDRLVGLADVIPVAPLREVLSFGDLLTAVGTADVVVHLLAPAAGRRTKSSATRPGRDAAAAPGAGG